MGLTAIKWKIRRFNVLPRNSAKFFSAGYFVVKKNSIREEKRLQLNFHSPTTAPHTHAFHFDWHDTYVREKSNQFRDMVCYFFFIV